MDDRVDVMDWMSLEDRCCCRYDLQFFKRIIFDFGRPVRTESVAF
jgi:hypothetical protein